MHMPREPASVWLLWIVQDYPSNGAQEGMVWCIPFREDTSDWESETLGRGFNETDSCLLGIADKELVCISVLSLARAIDLSKCQTHLENRCHSLGVTECRSNPAAIGDWLHQPHRALAFRPSASMSLILYLAWGCCESSRITL
jgi:hypothetical protein